MSRHKFLTSADDSQLGRHVNELRRILRSADPLVLANLSAARYETGEDQWGSLYLRVWGRETRVGCPDFVAFDQQSGERASIMTQALLAYYFHTADGAPLEGHWISFSELPDGRFYSQAFQGYTGHKLAREFGDDVESVAQAASRLPRSEAHHSGVSIGNRNFSFQALPRVPLLLVYWQGDEDFPSSYQILFDASVVHYLPTDVCAILGSGLTRKLLVGRQRME